MREAQGADVSLLYEILGLGSVAGQIDGEVVERVKVLQGLLQEVLVGHRTWNRQGPPSLFPTPGPSITRAAWARTIIASAMRSGRPTRASGRTSGEASPAPRFGDR